MCVSAYIRSSFSIFLIFSTKPSNCLHSPAGFGCQSRRRQLRSGTSPSCCLVLFERHGGGIFSLKTVPSPFTQRFETRSEEPKQQCPNFSLSAWSSIDQKCKLGSAAFIPEARLICFRTARMVSDSHFGLCQIVRLLLLRDADGVCSGRQRRRRVTTLMFICAPVQKRDGSLLERSSNSSAFASSQSVNPRPFLCAYMCLSLSCSF